MRSKLLHFILGDARATNIQVDYFNSMKALFDIVDLLVLPTLILLSGVGTTCFSSCCDKDSAIIFTTGRLPDVNHP
jgi:hypothetical protein